MILFLLRNRKRHLEEKFLFTKKNIYFGFNILMKFFWGLEWHEGEKIMTGFSFFCMFVWHFLKPENNTCGRIFKSAHYIIEFGNVLPTASL